MLLLKMLRISIPVSFLALSCVLSLVKAESASSSHSMIFTSFSSDASANNSTTNELFGIVAGSGFSVEVSNSTSHQLGTFVHYLSSQSAPSCSDANFEPNNSSTEANTISINSINTRSICKAGDVDWFKFTLSGDSSISIETAGVANGDTRMWLYSSSQALLKFNDDRTDGGNGQPNTGLYSKIVYNCNAPLSAGTYYVRVDEYGSDDEIAEYQLSLNVTSCLPDNDSDGIDDVTDTDDDNDGMPDIWEEQHGFDKNDASDAGADTDSDGLTNLEEFQNDTDPTKQDSDGDGMNDKEEINSGRDPNDPKDGVNTKFEALIPILNLLVE